MRVGALGRTPTALPPGKTQNPLYRRLGWSQGRSGRARGKSHPHQDSILDRPAVASRYTDSSTYYIWK